MWLARQWTKSNGDLKPFDIFAPVRFERGAAAPIVTHGTVWSRTPTGRAAEQMVWHIVVGRQWFMFQYLDKSREELAAMVALLHKAEPDTATVTIEHNTLKHNKVFAQLCRDAAVLYLKTDRARAAGVIDNKQMDRIVENIIRRGTKGERQ
jgi:hypothetical protein